jgi:hypothetical protein
VQELGPKDDGVAQEKCAKTRTLHVRLVLVFVEVLVKGGGPLLITLGLDVFFIILAHAPKRLLIKINPDEIPRVLGYTPTSRVDVALSTFKE